MYDVNPKRMTPFCYTQIQTKQSGRFCIPVEPVNKAIVNAYIGSIPNRIQALFSDIMLTYDILGIALVCVVVLSFLAFLGLKRRRGGKIILYTSLFGILISFGFLAYSFKYEYNQTVEENCIKGIDQNGCSGFSGTIFPIMFWVAIGLAAFYLFIIIKYFRRIPFAVRLIATFKECNAVTKQIKWIPLIFCVFALVLGAVFIFTVTKGFSVGDIEVVDTLNIDGGMSKIIKYNIFMRVLACLQFLIFQWILSTILTLLDSVVAYSVSHWYFEKRKETVVIPLKKTLANIFKYHLGTVAMLTFYNLVFRIPAAILGYVRRILRQAHQYSNFIRFAQACCLACIHANERFFRYINRHLLIQMVIWGDGFDLASKKSWHLLNRNAPKIKSLDFLAEFLIFQARFFITALCSLGVYAYLSYVKISPMKYDLTQIFTSWTPAGVIFYTGFFYSSAFLSIYNIGTKTLIQCYLMDEEMFVGDQRYSTQPIKDFMDAYRAQLKKEEERQILVKKTAKKVARKIAPGYGELEQEEDEEDGDIPGGKNEKETKGKDDEDEDEDEDDDDDDDEDEDSDEDDEDDDEDEDEDEEDEDEDEDEEEEDEDEEDSDDNESQGGESQRSHLTSQSKMKVLNDSRPSTAKSIDAEKVKIKGKQAVKEESEEEDEDEEEVDSDEEEDEKPEKQIKSNRGASAQSNRSDIKLMNASQQSIAQQKKGSGAAIFNKKKGNNSTMKLDDDEDEDDDDARF